MATIFRPPILQRIVYAPGDRNGLVVPSWPLYLTTVPPPFFGGSAIELPPRRFYSSPSNQTGGFVVPSWPLYLNAVPPAFFGASAIELPPKRVYPTYADVGERSNLLLTTLALPFFGNVSEVPRRRAEDRFGFSGTSWPLYLETVPPPFFGSSSIELPPRRIPPQFGVQVYRAIVPSSTPTFGSATELPRPIFNPGSGIAASSTVTLSTLPLPQAPFTTGIWNNPAPRSHYYFDSSHSANFTLLTASPTVPFFGNASELPWQPWRRGDGQAAVSTVNLLSASPTVPIFGSSLATALPPPPPRIVTVTVSRVTVSAGTPFFGVAMETPRRTVFIQDFIVGLNIALATAPPVAATLPFLNPLFPVPERTVDRIATMMVLNLSLQALPLSNYHQPNPMRVERRPMTMFCDSIALRTSTAQTRIPVVLWSPTIGDGGGW